MELFLDALLDALIDGFYIYHIGYEHIMRS